MKYKIVGDSSCDISKEMERDMNISIAPLSFSLDGEEFIDDETLDLNDYLSKIAKSPNVAKSSCPSIQDYLERFEGDYDCVFGVTLSSELSGSYNSAMNAKAMFLEENPNKKAHIFNSYGASSVEILAALKIRELAEAGESFESIVEKVEAFIDDSKVMFVLDNIDTLEKNGRLSVMKAKIVRALNLKLILKANQKGEIDMVTKARGIKKALKKMVQEMDKIGNVTDEKTFVITHCNALDRAKYVKELAEELYNFKEIMILPTRGLSSTYTNEGGIIIGF